MSDQDEVVFQQASQSQLEPQGRAFEYPLEDWFKFLNGHKVFHDKGFRLQEETTERRGCLFAHLVIQRRYKSVPNGLR